MTTKEAGAILKIHPGTIRRYILEGTLPGEKVAGRWLIRLDKLDRYLLSPRAAEQGLARELIRSLEGGRAD